MKNGSKSDETIGLDLSDKTGLYVVLDAAGEVVREGKVVLTLAGVGKVFGARLPCRMAIEVGTHSPWLSRELARLGYEVIVANAREVKLISLSKKKNDREDAILLARLARLDPRLLRPVQHRGEQAQADLAVLRSRRQLVDARTKLINSVRGTVKATGMRLPKCSTDSFTRQVKDHLPRELWPALEPLLTVIANLTEQILSMTRALERMAEERYPETRLLRQVKGVGVVCALTFVLTLEEPGRFRRSRSVGSYLGMTARQRDSGEQKPQLRITKAGDAALRSVLVQSAHYILGRFGDDCDLRRWGLRLAGTGSKLQKKKAVVAVARKLSVLLHHLWATGEVYEPLRQSALSPAA
jgi:transposase